METINWQPQILENELIKLVPLESIDLERLYAVAADPAIWAQHPTKDRYKKEVFQLYFDSAIESKTAFLIFDKASNKLIGSSRYYDYKPENKTIAIGFTFLATDYWGGNYNKSIKKLMLDYGFQFVDSVMFHIGATNIRSQKAVEKIGGKKMKEFIVESNGQQQLNFEYELKRK